MIEKMPTAVAKDAKPTKNEAALISCTASIGSVPNSAIDADMINSMVTTDLAASQPGLYRDMQSAYAAYADAAGVLPMPADYNLARQVGINSMLFVYAPHYLPWIFAGVSLLVLVLWLRRRRRR